MSDSAGSAPGSAGSNDRATSQRSLRKARDRSMAVLLVGALLLMPPFAAGSVVDAPIFGMPAPLVYVFAVWLALIACAALLARPLRDGDEAASAAEADESGT